MCGPSACAPVGCGVVSCGPPPMLPGPSPFAMDSGMPMPACAVPLQSACDCGVPTDCGCGSGGYTNSYLGCVDSAAGSRLPGLSCPFTKMLKSAFVLPSSLAAPPCSCDSCVPGPIYANDCAIPLTLPDCPHCEQFTEVSNGWVPAAPEPAPVPAVEPHIEKTPEPTPGPPVIEPKPEPIVPQVSLPALKAPAPYFEEPLSTVSKREAFVKPISYVEPHWGARKR